VENGKFHVIAIHDSDRPKFVIKGCLTPASNEAEKKKVGAYPSVIARGKYSGYRRVLISENGVE
jgi:hypothetical protein